MRLLSKSLRRQGGGIAASLVPNQVDGSQVSFHPFADGTVDCIPFQDGSTLPDRKLLIITFPTDNCNMGNSSLTVSNGYETRGSRRGTSYVLDPVVGAYSNRKQFLRGQYFQVSLASNVEFCARDNGGGEEMTAMELS